MERLSKTLINPEKVIKSEDLVNYRGGDELGGTCAARMGSQCFDNLSRTEAIFMACCDPDGTNCDGNWCCDSCGEASWYPCQ